MKRCPVCKKRTRKYDDIDGTIFGEYCKEGHYEWLDIPDGMSMRVGKKHMPHIYEGTIRWCRVQNMIIKRWISQERKRFNKSK